RLPSLDSRKAVRVTGVVAVHAVDPAGRVADRTGEAAQHHCQRFDLGVRATGEAAVGCLEAEQSRVAGRDADGTAAVTTAGDGHETSGNGSGRSTRGSAGCALQVPRIARDTVELGGRVVDEA